MIISSAFGHKLQLRPWDGLHHIQHMHDKGRWPSIPASHAVPHDDVLHRLVQQETPHQIIQDRIDELGGQHVLESFHRSVQAAFDKHAVYARHGETSETKGTLALGAMSAQEEPTVGPIHRGSSWQLSIHQPGMSTGNSLHFGDRSVTHVQGSPRNTHSATFEPTPEDTAALQDRSGTPHERAARLLMHFAKHPTVGPHITRFIGHEDHPFKLARMQAPAGGAIVGNQFSPGGRFLPRAFARVRDVMSRLRQPAKLSRPKTTSKVLSQLLGHEISYTHTPGGPWSLTYDAPGKTGHTGHVGTPDAHLDHLIASGAEDKAVVGRMSQLGAGPVADDFRKGAKEAFKQLMVVTPLENRTDELRVIEPGEVEPVDLQASGWGEGEQRARKSGFPIKIAQIPNPMFAYREHSLHHPSRQLGAEDNHVLIFLDHGKLVHKAPGGTPQTKTFTPTDVDREQLDNPNRPGESIRQRAARILSHFANHPDVGHIVSDFLGRNQGKPVKLARDEDTPGAEEWRHPGSRLSVTSHPNAHDYSVHYHVMQEAPGQPPTSVRWTSGNDLHKVIQGGFKQGTLDYLRETPEAQEVLGAHEDAMERHFGEHFLTASSHPGLGHAHFSLFTPTFSRDNPSGHLIVHSWGSTPKSAILSIGDKNYPIANPDPHLHTAISGMVGNSTDGERVELPRAKHSPQHSDAAAILHHLAEHHPHLREPIENFLGGELP